MLIPFGDKKNKVHVYLYLEVGVCIDTLFQCFYSVCQCLVFSHQGFHTPKRGNADYWPFHFNTYPAFFSQKIRRLITSVQHPRATSTSVLTQSSGCCYEPESKSIHITDSIWFLAGSGQWLEARQDGRAATRSQSAKEPGKIWRQSYIRQPLQLPLPTASWPTPPPWHPAGICGIQKLWFSSGNVIGPSHHLGLLEECV